MNSSDEEQLDSCISDSTTSIEDDINDDTNEALSEENVETEQDDNLETNSKIAEKSTTVDGEPP